MTSYGRLAHGGERYRTTESRRVKILIGVVLILILLLFLQRNKGGDAASGTDDEAFLANWRRDTQLNKVYAITPTYARPVQKAELTRLSHVLQLSPHVHWIIVEDAATQSKLVQNLITHVGLQHRTTILNIPTPTIHKQKIPNYQQPRGVSQRNLALQWIRDNVGDASQPYHQSVVFFMDDDNTYTVDLFREMAKIEPGRVGVWPVGLVGGLPVEKPLLDDAQEKVVGFNSLWRPERPFPVDMAGFAISLDLLIANPEAKFSYDVERGYQETEILRQVTTLANLQPMANRCTEVLVWHTRTEAPKLTGKSKFTDDLEVRR